MLVTAVVTETPAEPPRAALLVDARSDEVVA